MNPAVYDAGALIAAERGDRALWAEHKVRLELGEQPVVPAEVVAQVSRSGRRAPLRQLLRGCQVVSIDEVRGHAVGRLLGRSNTTDVVDAIVALEASTRRAEVYTSDPADIAHLLSALRARLPIVAV